MGVGLLVAMVTGCGPRAGPSPTTLHVLAASSLTDAFGALAQQFTAIHPDVEPVVSTAGSQTLRVQIEHGSPGDVFASANPIHIQALVDAGLVTTSQGFARGGLTLVVPANNPAAIETLTQLPQATRLVLGTDEVPIGRYTAVLLERANGLYGRDFRARVEANLVSREPNVRLVLAKVALGEADAAIVYRSDVIGAPGIRSIAIPAALDITAEYFMGILQHSQQPILAQRWIDYVMSEPGQATLNRYGFLSAP